jgi:hypothetical protein
MSWIALTKNLHRTPLEKIQNAKLEKSVAHSEVS